MLQLVRISPRTDGKSTNILWNGKTNSILFSIRHAYFSAEAGYLSIRAGYWKIRVGYWGGGVFSPYRLRRKHRVLSQYCNIALHLLFGKVRREI